MWCSAVGTRYVPVFITSHRVSQCVRLLSHVTEQRAEIHINNALRVQKFNNTALTRLTYNIFFWFNFRVY
jgi:hypothetical protein